MAKYIIFYRNDYKDKTKFIECIGSGSIIEPDQRYSINTLINKVLNKEYYRPTDAIAFAIGSGNSIFKINLLTNIIKL